MYEIHALKSYPVAASHEWVNQANIKTFYSKQVYEGKLCESVARTQNYVHYALKFV